MRILEEKRSEAHLEPSKTPTMNYFCKNKNILKPSFVRAFHVRHLKESLSLSSRKFRKSNAYRTLLRPCLGSF